MVIQCLDIETTFNRHFFNAVYPLGSQFTSIYYYACNIFQRVDILNDALICKLLSWFNAKPVHVIIYAQNVLFC